MRTTGGTCSLKHSGCEPEEFYATLNEYTITASPEPWYEGDVVDAGPVMPSEDIRLEDIFSQTS